MTAPDPRSDAALIETRDLTVHFGKRRVLEGVSLRIPAGQVTSFIGPSGCGKSTLLHCFNRMNDLEEGFRIEGRVRIGGEDIYRNGMDVIGLRRRVGMVFQHPRLFPGSVRGNIAFGPRIRGIRDRKRLDEIVESSLRAASLWEEVGDRLGGSALALSGGQQQRLCIARAIAAEPEILLMDQPASDLDPGATARIEELILDLRRKYTIVVVTHDMQEAARISDWTVFLSRGRLVEQDRTRVIFTSPSRRETENYVTGRAE